jgi:hypothetical protein
VVRGGHRFCSQQVEKRAPFPSSKGPGASSTRSQRTNPAFQPPATSRLLLTAGEPCLLRATGPGPGLHQRARSPQVNCSCNINQKPASVSVHISTVIFDCLDRELCSRWPRLPCCLLLHQHLTMCNKQQASALHCFAGGSEFGVARLCGQAQTQKPQRIGDGSGQCRASRTHNAASWLGALDGARPTVGRISISPSGSSPHYKRLLAVCCFCDLFCACAVLVILVARGGKVQGRGRTPGHGQCKTWGWFDC